MEVLETLEKVFAHNMRKARGELTQPQMAERLGVSTRGYQKWEDGNVPQAKTRRKIAQKLGVPETALFLDPDLSTPTAEQIASVLSAALKEPAFQRDLADLLEDYMTAIRRKP